MIDAIGGGCAPHFVLLHYRLPAWLICNLLLIPKFGITESAIVPRKPLSATARRKHWQGYTLDLRKIPEAAKIMIVAAGVAREPKLVREDFERISGFEKMRLEQRGWALDVLRCVDDMKTTEFTNQQIYAYAPELAKLHPENRHIYEKIRQQLQVLRDLNFLEHMERGVWRRR